jgi:hypothetical protein
LLVLVASGHAQTLSVAPPAPDHVVGFVSPYEIARTLRAAGFDVLAPPLREGTIYVVRANDFRGLLMRVVVDARTGAIRDASRIVPGPGRYGQLHGAPPPYDPADFDASVPLLGDSEMRPPMPPLPSASPIQPIPSMAPAPAMAPTFSLARPSSITHVIPLPRPRPAALASRYDISPAAVTEPISPAPASGAATTGSGADSAARPEPAAKPQVSTEVMTAAPPSVAAVPSVSGTATSQKKPATPAPPLND